LPIPEYNNSDSVIFRDLDETKQKIVKNILKSKTWKDNYGTTRYFQPNKNITR
jgi:hypothetical protein